MAWGGIVAIIRALVASGAFGVEFPEECPDGAGPVGTHDHDLSLALRAEIPEVEWPLDESSPPPTLAALDLLEFCHRVIAEPIQGSFHSFFRHYHLQFDRDSGQLQFCEKINRILARNGIAFQLTDAGEIERLAPPGLREELARGAPSLARQGLAARL